MQWIDMHCDSLSVLFQKDPVQADLYSSAYTSVDFKRMKQADALAQCFAIFMVPQKWYEAKGATAPSDEEYIAALHGYFEHNLAQHSEFVARATNAKELAANRASGKPSAILTMEDGRAVEGKLENIRRFYDMGVRMLSLTWNFENCFGAPNSSDPAIMQKGLAAFGKEAVQYMQELGMLVDVSHLSDGGFYDVAKLCKKPFVASHSNARALSAHQRNLTDDMIRVLGNCGGAAGINFAPSFLNADLECAKSTVQRMAEHAAHLKNVGGIECVALGSDLDGIEGELEIDSCDKMGLLEAALQKQGFAGEEVEKVFYKNALRVFDCAMK